MTEKKKKTQHRKSLETILHQYNHENNLNPEVTIESDMQNTLLHIAWKYEPPSI